MPNTDGGPDIFPWSFTPMPLEPLFAMVDSINEVAIGFTEGEIPSAVISAEGMVPTGGWQFGLLAPKFTTDHQRDEETWDLLFLGRLPMKDMLHIQKFTRIQGGLVTNLPSWAKAIRVIASKNEKVIPVPSVENSRIKTLTWGRSADGIGDAFPW